MTGKLLKKYSLITKFNWGIAAVLLLLNFYLYSRLPRSVPIHLNLFNQPDNMGGKMIIWVFPLIFVVFEFFFRESRIDHLSFISLRNNRMIKIGLLIFQLILWVLILRSYSYYFTLI
ncbi:DUF1648 domain-containing protein [Enterococcus caccae]|uniref:DUF1648 domain-containing protein n=1 Tax=Enterococcus caccae ATCC BAA-1240 TaxID=1158612 RepID=R3WT38_9ENTE|nr:DUF1648 domain-containing protein [Enterococcus caccae]EOL50572.1 hypothetical protein UC7_00345 [Enterococcus caccae ATCC BAA-1240]EOT59212.1 hypothetical protein I580_02244 [Enterococcus caccae ATCC BAA-1240]